MSFRPPSGYYLIPELYMNHLLLQSDTTNIQNDINIQSSKMILLSENKQ